MRRSGRPSLVGHRAAPRRAACSRPGRPCAAATGSRSPSTRITAVSGSTRAPSWVTTAPSTSTRPAAISSSQRRRLATPGLGQHLLQPDADRADDVGVRAVVGSESRSVTRSRPEPGRSSSPSISAISGRNGAISGSSSRPVRPIRSRKYAVVRNRCAPLSGSTPASSTSPRVDQGAHHAVDVDAADRRDPGPADRLPVGDDGERLERRRGEPGLLAVEDEALDHARRTRRASRTASRRRPRAARNPGPASAYSAGERLERAAHLVHRARRPPGRAGPGRAAGR